MGAQAGPDDAGTVVLPGGAAPGAAGTRAELESPVLELAPQPAVARPAQRLLPPLPDNPWGRVAGRVEAWWAIIDQVAQDLQIPQALIEAVIHDESGGDPDAFPEHPERDGASFGLMQLLLPTAREVGFAGKVRELFAPGTNIPLGARYLASLLHRYGTPSVALAAYNGGPRAAWLVAHGLPAGAAGRYSRTVMALFGLYLLRNHGRTL